MNAILEGVLADLEAEGDQLEGLLIDLGAADWRRATPAVGWDIATTIAHLTWTDEVAVKAAVDKAAWDAVVLEAIADPEGFVDAMAFKVAALDSVLLLERWRAARPILAQVLREVPEGEKLPWFGPPMSPTSMATARFMETWAHGLDIADSLGVVLEPTDRIKHVCHLGVRTRNYSFVSRELATPDEDFHVVLTSPSGQSWTWGPTNAAQRVSGPAQDFAMLVTQRVHRADTDLVAIGADAEKWLEIAQAFAGPPGAGRQPGANRQQEGAVDE